MIRLAAKTLRNQNGTAAIEFAILAPTLFLFVLGIIEFSMIMFASSAVESATNISSRYGRTGNNYAEYVGDHNQTTASREQFIREEIAQRTLGLLNPTSVKIETATYANFKDSNRNDTSANTARGFGSGSEAVLYKVSYEWPVITPILAGLVSDKDGSGNSTGKYTITSAIIVKNEAF